MNTETTTDTLERPELADDESETKATAVQIAERLRSLFAGKRAAEADNAKDQARLKALAAELAGLEAKLSGEDLGALREVAARKQQIELLTSKAAKDAEARLATADKALTAMGDEGEIGEWFGEVQRQTVERATQALTPYCANSAQSTYIVARLEKIMLLARWVSVFSSRISWTDAASLLTVLDAFAAGNPPWLSSSQTTTGNEQP